MNETAPRRLVAILVVALTACSTEVAGPTAPGTQRGSLSEAAIPTQLEPVTGIRFPMPPELKAEITHHDQTLPAKKFKHSIHFVGEGGVELLIDVWNNTEGLALQPWFDKYLSFLVDDYTQPTERTMTRSRLPGIVLVQPQSPQALSMAVAVFARGSQVFRITCIDYDGIALPQSRAHFFALLDQLEVGVEQ